MAVSDFFSVGDKVKVSGVRTPVTITFVGPITVLGIGARGGKYGFVQNVHDNLIYCLTPKKQKIVMKNFKVETVDYTKDTIESKLKDYAGQDIVTFLDDQLGYFLLKRANSMTENEREHYQKQLDITGTALELHVTRVI